MPDLLLELFSEEIPARMQARAAEDLRKGVTDRLVAAGLAYEGARAFVTPRRLTLAVHGVPARQPDVKEERKGPRLNSSLPARQGFLRTIGVPPHEAARFELTRPGESIAIRDLGLVVEARGDGDNAFYFAMREKPGRAAIEVIGEILPDVIKNFPWPKMCIRDSNNSTDGTSDAAAQAGAVVRREPHQGKGHVVRRMFNDCLLYTSRCV